MPEIVNKSKEQKGAESEVDGFRKDLGPFVVAAETTRMAMVFTDAKSAGNPIIFANTSFLALTGYKKEEVLGRSFNSLMAQGVTSEELAGVEAAFRGSADKDLIIHYRHKDASEFWADVFTSPVRDEGGDIVQHFVSFVDLTKHIEEQAHSKLLINELNHRVKNALSTLQSIISQAFRRSSDPKVILNSIESRLFALSRSHDLLTREMWEGAGLLDLVNTALKPFEIDDDQRDRFEIKGKNILLPSKTTLALGIALHELATNAAKYGAFSNDTGSILITWSVNQVAGKSRLILRWQERDGPPVARPSHTGFGSQVIERGLALELQGTVQVEYRQDGLVCVINIPLS